MRTPISGLTATYAKLLMSTVIIRAGVRWGDAKITREGYDGGKECDSRPVPCGWELLQNVRAAALVKRPANGESPSDFYFKQMLC